MFEVEMKFRVPSFEKISTKLATLGAAEHKSVDEEDTYFNHPQRDFAQTDEAFRVRRSGGEVFITYKGPKLDQTTKTREEIELPLVAGLDTVEQCTALFQLLGFRPVATVRKNRRRYLIEGSEQGVEITLDNVHEVGTFVELEIRAEAAEVEKAKTKLRQLASDLGLTDGERRSYLELLITARKTANS